MRAGAEELEWAECGCRVQQCAERAGIVAAPRSLGSVGALGVECGIAEHAAHHSVSRPQHLPSVLPREVRGHRLRQGEHCERTNRGGGERDAGRGDIESAGIGTMWLAMAAMAGPQRGGAAYRNRQMGRRRSDTDHDAAARPPHPVRWRRHADLWIAARGRQLSGCGAASAKPVRHLGRRMPCALSASLCTTRWPCAGQGRSQSIKCGFALLVHALAAVRIASSLRTRSAPASLHGC